MLLREVTGQSRTWLSYLPGRAIPRHTPSRPTAWYEDQGFLGTNTNALTRQGFRSLKESRTYLAVIQASHLHELPVPGMRARLEMTDGRRREFELTGLTVYSRPAPPLLERSPYVRLRTQTRRCRFASWYRVVHARPHEYVLTCRLRGQ